MARQEQHSALRGGLDLVSSPLTVAPGRAWTMLNYVPVEAGYKRILGYERKDGRPSPSEASYWMLGYTGGPASVGDTITGATNSGTAVVLAVTDDEYVLGKLDGTIANGETLNTGAGEAVGTPRKGGAATIALDLTYRDRAASNRRSAIQKVPGSGPVRGVWFYMNDLYAFRDNAAGTAGVMHKATSSGWSEVALGVALNFDAGSVEPLIGDRVSAAGGVEAELAGYTVSSGSWDSNDAAGTLWLLVESVAPFRDNATLRRGAGGSEADFATADGTATATTLPAGGAYRFVNHNFRGQAASEEMYGVNGVGKSFRYGGTALVLISTGHADDRPTHVAVQSEHLLLAYRGGSLIVSETGNPDGYKAAVGAAEIGAGQDIFGLAQGVGLGNTLLLGADHIQVLYGKDSDDFNLVDQSDSQTGGVEGTLQQVGGPLYMDNRGVRSVTTTQAYGNFVIGTMTADIQPWIDKQRGEKNPAIGSMRVRSSDQYRLWFRSGIGICVYLGRGRPEISFFDYGFDEEGQLGFDEGSREPSAAHIVTGVSSGATARIDSAAVDSGTWGGGDAAGTLRLFDVIGTFQDDEVLRTSAGVIGRVNGTVQPASNQVYPVCVVSAEDADRIERVYFGAPNGFVYEAERGRSFDGREITAYCRLPLNHMGRPAYSKRYFSADLHMDLESSVKVSLSAIYGDGLQPEQGLTEGEVFGGGGVWDEAIWDDFYWDAPLNGYHSFDLIGFGRNVSILMVTKSKLEAPHTLNGVTLHYAMRRAER